MPGSGWNTTGFNVYLGNQGGSGGGSGVFQGSTSFSEADIGMDILAGATGPLGPGTYTIELREFGNAQQYQLTHVLVPAPGALAAFGVFGLAGLGRRRRR